jgi:glycosyltransferase involved in cell wall biosynthesis
MNILFISSHSPLVSIGGIERYLANLIDYCKNQSDFKAIIMLPTTSDSYSQEVGNITLYYENSLYLSRNNPKKQIEISQKAHLFSEAVKKIIKKHQIEIICAENFLDLPPAYSLLLNMTAGFYKIPTVLRLHSFTSTELKVELTNQLMWSHISCVSKSVSGDCFHKGADINILSTDYLGVNTKEFNRNVNTTPSLKVKLQLPQESKIILTATRIIRGKNNVLKDKGLINLIQAFSKLSPRFPSWRLIIAIGKAPDNLQLEFNASYEMLLGYIKLHNIEDKTILKLFKLEEMPQVYMDSDLFVLPSENETFGQVFIEAMACGLPVIGTNVGGIPEIISDSYNGYLVPPDNPSVLAQRIEKLINDHSTRDRFIRNGLRTVTEKFTSQNQIPNFIKMLEDIPNNLNIKKTLFAQKSQGKEVYI